MQGTYIWNKLRIQRPKVVCLVMAIMVSVGCFGQGKKWVRKNNPNYDERKFSYGFLIGLHSSALHIEYSDKFVTPDFDTLYAVHPERLAAFSLRFIVNYGSAESLDFRITPSVVFHQHMVKYVSTNVAPADPTVQTALVEMPLLAISKSVRRGNVG